MRAPRRSEDPAGHCLPSDDAGRGEHEPHECDRKHTHDSHLGGPDEIARYQRNVSFIGLYRPFELPFGRAPTATPRRQVSRDPDFGWEQNGNIRPVPSCPG